MICNQKNVDSVCPVNTTEFCSCLHLIEVNINDLVELVFVDELVTQFDINVESIHPIHIHGHTFAVVAIDTVNFIFNKFFIAIV